MQADPLSQLRDVHLPVEPSWWPPAPGWWLLGIVALIAVWWLVNRLLAAYARGRPRRQALDEHAALRLAWNAGEIDARTYLDECNALLKRLWVHVLKERDAAALSGERWLHYLDVKSGSTYFTEGGGTVLGHGRFAPVEPDIDDTLSRHIDKLLKETRVDAS